MDGLRVYTMQGNDSMRTIMVAFYERFIATKGGPRLELSPVDAIEFGEYLIENLADFQAEMASMEASMQRPCQACGKPRKDHSYDEMIACVEKQAKEHGTDPEPPRAG
jgi:hypothetical protein